MSKNKYHLGIVGATGMVGQVIRTILIERKFPVKTIRFFASERSAGTTLNWDGKEYLVENAATADTSELDIAIFSAGAKASLLLAEKYASHGTIVIDNSSAWRSHPNVPLIVSEVNPEDICLASNGIIANPNCTTMATMPVLKPLHDKAEIVSMVVSTYQATSGAGVSGACELEEQLRYANKNIQELIYNGNKVKFPTHKNFPKTIAFNVVPQAGQIVDDGSMEAVEEKKLRNESRKILHIDNLLVSGTCVRVPVFTGHSLSVNVRFKHPITPNQAKKILSKSSGVKVTDIPNPLMVTGKNEVYVGRIRKDYSIDGDYGLAFFVSADNLRKGAALNAIQISELLINR